ncbi:hypothetical protein K503DRAFT_774901 [Rhizopogon vinicolor AM-OR11-026]|uniref:Uncharacterized protein n=1 Tax=Rhizopogon vinicolor AM-OR11-026 TaxID=1314800 RepID=A0A1B7MNE5_9AGAM|nr:hypothetical protein K503DRAFT_774901 [Rhizopogon vinicolor AM-OR11-026]
MPIGPSNTDPYLPTLNALLVALSLPFELASPTDTTPSLLLAVLESILESYLPIPASIRASRSSLAEGFPWQTVLLGRKRGIIDALVGDDSEGEVGLTASILLRPEPSYVELSHITDVPRHPHVPSPSTRSTATTSAQIDLSMHDAPPVESDTGIAYSELLNWTETQPIRGNTLKDPSYFLERNVSYTSSVDDSIEEFDPDLSTQSTSSAEQPLTPTPQPLRFKGWIGAGHSELDPNTFAANKLNTSTPINDRSRHQSSTSTSDLYRTTRSSTPRMQMISMRMHSSAPSGWM